MPVGRMPTVISLSSCQLSFISLSIFVPNICLYLETGMQIARRPVARGHLTQLLEAGGQILLSHNLPRHKKITLQ